MFLQNKINKAKKGDSKAFQELIEEEKAKLYRTAYLYVKDENDALDIVQETVYKAYISIKKVKEVQHFSTWLTRILINNALDFLKKKSRLIPIDSWDNSSLVREEQHEENMDLLHAIDQLKPRYKTVIILRYYNDYTIKQIAETLKCPEGTVKTNLHRALSKLKVDLREEYIQ
ncbi:sigma-70 family RNA polymerase sigma factor [Gottfriedia acidiceleris]|uniref:sigma-70 family RNA polymerase sigma factor n=1 Tax=Gottfriedia acidiceleris TaxID=371036 RepID=UPI000B42F09D|nr:sigma-70 family RNA polymerase sigma factor [Gottfriedia acidiceleris]